MLDSKDMLIIKILKRDSRTSISEIAKKLGISNTATKKRLKKLMEKGVIQKFTIKLNPIIEGVRLHLLIAHVRGEDYPKAIKLLNSSDVEAAYVSNVGGNYILYIFTENLEDNAIKEIKKMAKMCPTSTVEKIS